MYNKEDISGVEYEYYFVCPTMLWLYSHGLIKANEDENIKEGKIIHENIYKREKREVEIGRSKFDVLKLKDKYIVYERKKSKIFRGQTHQLKFYLYQLYLKGINAEGFLIVPGKRIHVLLRDKDKEEIKVNLLEIKRIKNSPNPPKPIKKKICNKCAYRDFCFGDLDE